MAFSYDEAIRNDRLQVVADAINAGAAAGKLRIYDGVRPATGAAVTTQTLLAELTMADPCQDTITGGILTFDTITTDSSADNSGTATWMRIVDSDGNFCVDGDVGTSGADLNLNSTSIIAGQSVAIVSAQITAGND